MSYRYAFLVLVDMFKTSPQAKRHKLSLISAGKILAISISVSAVRFGLSIRNVPKMYFEFWLTSDEKWFSVCLMSDSKPRLSKVISVPAAASSLINSGREVLNRVESCWIVHQKKPNSQKQITDRDQEMRPSQELPTTLHWQLTYLAKSRPTKARDILGQYLGKGYWSNLKRYLATFKIEKYHHKNLNGKNENELVLKINLHPNEESTR